jgi:hypothetical protein
METENNSLGTLVRPDSLAGGLAVNPSRNTRRPIIALVASVMAASAIGVLTTVDLGSQPATRQPEEIASQPQAIPTATPQPHRARVRHPAKRRHTKRRLDHRRKPSHPRSERKKPRTTDVPRTVTIARPASAPKPMRPAPTPTATGFTEEFF